MKVMDPWLDMVAEEPSNMIVSGTAPVMLLPTEVAPLVFTNEELLPKFNDGAISLNVLPPSTVTLPPSARLIPPDNWFVLFTISTSPVGPASNVYEEVIFAELLAP